jgi:hypothetical protein
MEPQLKRQKSHHLARMGLAAKSPKSETVSCHRPHNEPSKSKKYHDWALTQAARPTNKSDALNNGQTA